MCSRLSQSRAAASLTRGRYGVWKAAFFQLHALPDASLLCWKYSGELLPTLLAMPCREHADLDRRYTSMSMLRLCCQIAARPDWRSEAADLWTQALGEHAVGRGQRAQGGASVWGSIPDWGAEWPPPQRRR